jgi:hypothetical protein
MVEVQVGQQHVHLEAGVELFAETLDSRAGVQTSEISPSRRISTHDVLPP